MDNETRNLRIPTDPNAALTDLTLYPMDDTDPTRVADDRPVSSRHVAAALRALPDWSVSATVLRSTYSSDVSQDGVWGALADLAGLDTADLALQWE